MTNKSERRKFLDNIFNAFTIIGRGNYVAVYDVKGGITRFSPAAVDPAQPPTIIKNSSRHFAKDGQRS